MAADTTTSFSSLLKEIWPQKQIYDMLNYGMPFFALLRKDSNLAVQNHLAAGYGTSQGVSADFSSAKANKQPESNAGFKFGPGQIYSLASVDRQLIRLSRGDARAIIGALDRAAQQAILGWKFECATQLWGNGGGAIGQVSSVSNGNLLLTNVDDVVKFDVNMTVQAAPDDGSGQTTAVTAVRPGQVQIGKVHRQVSEATAHLIPSTGNWTDAGNIPGITTNDYLFRAGNYNNVVMGVGSWIPAADPGSTDNFGGQNRSFDPLRLSGIKLTATGKTPREAAMFIVREALRNSASPTHLFENPTNFGDLQLELQQAGMQIVTKEAPAAINNHVFGEPIDGIGFIGTRGVVKVYADDRVPTGNVFALQLDTWYISGAGEFPSLVAEDGLTIMREEWTDSFELRVVGDLQLFCVAPGLNVRATVS
jgi:hypothetical protein